MLAYSIVTGPKQTIIKTKQNQHEKNVQVICQSKVPQNKQQF